MTPPQPPYGQPPQPGQQPGYPQQGYPQQQPGFPQQPAYPQPQAGHPQGYPQQPQSAGPGRVVGFIIAAIAVIAGIYIVIDGFDSLRGILLCVTGGLALIAGGVLLALRFWVSPFVLLGASILLLANLAWSMVYRVMTMDPGDTLAEELFSFAGIATFAPGAIVTGLAFLPVVRGSLKPKPGGSQTARPVQFGGHPQHGGFAHPPQQPGYLQQQGYVQQPGYPPQQPGPQQPGGYPPQ